ncbi:5-methyltetrahydropteroyltriglutamate--homocysteine S-methyltransferase [Rickettsiales bacterium]|nr:5-methyltetrahydropteroyltriglutamate--homocysteine S-methyltransferase [Rickettsiales bacterium]
MVVSANLGFPRVGSQRELKKAQESFWKGEISAEDLTNTATELRARHWKIQQDAGVGIIPSNDFSLYDQILDTICMVGAVPSRYGFSGNNIDLDTFFAMARGRQSGGQDVVAMEMTKWFDTNYHYIVPEFEENQEFALKSSKAVDEFKEALALGIKTRPVLVGPVTFLLIGKARNENVNPLSLLPKLLPVYEEVLKQLEAAGASDVQIDEPALVLDLDSDAQNAYKAAFDALSKASNLNITLATYFGDLRGNLDVTVNLPVNAIHFDLVRAPNQLDDVLAKIPGDKSVSLGVVDGRNIWKNDLNKSLETIEKAKAALGSDRIIVAPSCSLLHSPADLEFEVKLDAELKNWLAFAKQKLSEVSVIANAARDGKDSVAAELEENQKAIDSRKSSALIHNDEVKARAANVSDDVLKRNSEFKTRIQTQKSLLNLPLLPTTTIGSFPQTADLRAVRRQFKNGTINREQYDAEIASRIDEAVAWQDEIGIDVPVHGEFERNDMVEYFGEKLNGFAFTQNGWVQSYGSRCVKPPVIFGDVSRAEPMTVRWSEYAQSKTDKPMKGMLTGPVTILQWSFVRDDQPRSETCKQIAFAIRDEVLDLEKAGIKIIQIDEAALREGLPLRKDDWKQYLDWAVESFHITANGVKDETQIHTHMCYSEFNDIIEAVAAMDADVISIETSRSAMELLDAFVAFKYPNEIGPGVYDIHSPRVPKQAEMETLLRKALEVLSPEQVWVNPDCGLKTRGWAEVKTALEYMVSAAKTIRSEIAQGDIKAVANS